MGYIIPKGSAFMFEHAAWIQLGYQDSDTQLLNIIIFLWSLTSETKTTPFNLRSFEHFILYLVNDV